MKKRLAFLSLGLVVGLAGVATASAYIFNAPASTSIQGGLDQGVVLDWGTSAKLQGTKTLVYGVAQVETVTLAEPVKSATIAGYAKLTFSLGKPTSGELALEGLKVEVSDQSFSGSEVIPDLTVDSANQTGSLYISVEGWEGEKTYYVRLSLEEQTAVNADLTVSLDYSETDLTVQG